MTLLGEVLSIDIGYRGFADGHLQKLLLTACRDDTVVVVVVDDVVDVVEVVAGGNLHLSLSLNFFQVLSSRVKFKCQF